MSAVISPCGRYRYRLERNIGVDEARGATAIIMVNPSTADAEDDDHTIRKLQGFARANGWGRIVVGNLFAWRSRDVSELAHVEDPVGPDNDLHLTRIVDEAALVVCAWGAVTKQPKAWRGLRWRRLLKIAGGRQLYSIGPPAKCGHPCHPLMLSYDLAIMPWSAPA